MPDGRDAQSPATVAPDAPAPRGSLRGRFPDRRRALLVGVPVLAAVLVAAGVYAITRPDPEPPRPAPPGPVASWLSGAAVDSDVEAFAEWRGAPVEITATWADADPSLQTQLPLLRRGEEFGEWDRDLDLAIGAIGEDETWSEAADGAYDARWRRSLTTMARLWDDRPGTLYIRFAHEMNGDWYPWAVTADDRDDFITAWKRFRALQQEVFPESQLVFCLTRESVDSGIDWRETFPGAEYVDVLGVDYYNQYPYVDSVAEFDASATETDEWGGPKGIQGYQDFAREQGLPLAFPEWGGNATEGDAPAFIW